MEVGVVRGRRSAAERGGGEGKESRESFMETTTERKPPCMVMMKRVQVVYYLTRNGQLEHPHFMELAHSPNHLLRLKDFVDRLTALRGRGMPSLYSWSCKRTYKNGYVWNDLGENDVIYPADGAAGEYVLKGSEIVLQPAERSPTTSRQMVVHNHHHHQPKPADYIPNPKTKQRPLESCTAALPPRTRPCSRELLEPEPESPEEFDEEDEIEEGKASYSTTSSTTPRSRCSRGVSTDEPPEEEQGKQGNQLVTHHTQKNPLVIVKRFQEEEEDGGSDSSDPESIKESSATRSNSVLLQLISCGSFVPAPPPPKLKTKLVATFKHPPLPAVVKREVIGSSRRMGRITRGAGEEEEEAIMIKYMSENPRFGNPQSQDKEFFSGSIVESIAAADHHQSTPGMASIKRSNSYGEQRNSSKETAAHVEVAAAAGAGAGAGAGAEAKNRGGGIKGKCMPRLRSSK